MTDFAAFMKYHRDYLVERLPLQFCARANKSPVGMLQRNRSNARNKPRYFRMSFQSHANHPADDLVKR
jgi:hypothetical protein